jgi:uncharacterized RDD family membrane protein YckC
MTSARRPAGFAALPVKAQGVQGARAGAASRGAANIIDALVLFVGFIGLYLGVAAVKFLWRPRTFTFPAPSWNVITIIVCGVTALYFAVAWMTTGRTYGDRVLGLRVVNRVGARVHALTALLRAAACVIVPIGLLWVAVDRNSRSLQDLIFRTSVIYDWSEATH